MAEEAVIRDYRKEDLPAVKWLMLQYLPRFYDDIDESFSENLLRKLTRKATTLSAISPRQSVYGSPR
jgi:hypothetical protein